MDEVTKTVEFENGNEVTVAADGRVVDVERNSVEAFYDALEDMMPVDTDTSKITSAFIGCSGGEIMSEYRTDLFDIAEQNRVEITALWPVLSGDDTERPLYIDVEEV